MGDGAANSLWVNVECIPTHPEWNAFCGWPSISEWNGCNSAALCNYDLPAASSRVLTGMHSVKSLITCACLLSCVCAACVWTWATFGATGIQCRRYVSAAAGSASPSRRVPFIHLFSISSAALGWSIGTMWPASCTWQKKRRGFKSQPSPIIRSSFCW